MPVLMNLWTHEDHAAVRKAITTALRGVGDEARVHMEHGTVAIHIRRAMIPKEFQGLPRKRGERFPIELAGDVAI